MICQKDGVNRPGGNAGDNRDIEIREISGKAPQKADLIGGSRSAAT